MSREEDGVGWPSDSSLWLVVPVPVRRCLFWSCVGSWLNGLCLGETILSSIHMTFNEVALRHQTVHLSYESAVLILHRPLSDTQGLL